MRSMSRRAAWMTNTGPREDRIGTFSPGATHVPAFRFASYAPVGHSPRFHAGRDPDRRDHPGHPGRDRDPAVHEREHRRPQEQPSEPAPDDAEPDPAVQAPAQ